MYPFLQIKIKIKIIKIKIIKIKIIKIKIKIIKILKLKLLWEKKQYFLIFFFLAVTTFFVEFSIMGRKSLNIVLLRRKRALYMGFTVLLSLYKLGRAAQCDPRKIKSFGS